MTKTKKSESMPRPRQRPSKSPDQILLRQLKKISDAGRPMTLRDLRISHGLNPASIYELAAKYPDKLRIGGNGRDHVVILGRQQARQPRRAPRPRVSNRLRLPKRHRPPQPDPLGPFAAPAPPPYDPVHPVLIKPPLMTGTERIRKY